MELQSLFDIYTRAVFEKDMEALLAIYDEQARVFDMWQQWTYDGRAALREMVKGWFSSLGADRDVVTFEDIQVESSGDLAVASAFARFSAVSAQGDTLRYLDNRLTWVARKKGDAWVIIHQHTSGPIDFSTMKVILERGGALI